jgi:hypothetical protein
MKVIGICPCGSKVFASENPPALAHEPPVCQKFDDLEVDEFLTYMRKALVGDVGDA